MTRVSKKLPQQQLAIELRTVTDAAMTVDPGRGAHIPAMRRLKGMLADNPGWRSYSHVVYNLGPRRIAWLEGLEKR